MKPQSKISWPDAAIRLGAVLPRERLEPAVVAWAGAANRRQTWGVAFSGGADSLALLLLVWAHWPERRDRLVALHFDHRLRGAESRADAAYCRRVCTGLGVSLRVGAWTARGRSRRPASEAEAREARQAFLGRHARAIWFGHQMDDVAESILMRLARGSGSGGLAAPRPVQSIGSRRVHLRPLMSLKKSELLTALQGLGIGWREDSSNAGGDYFRNRIRREVLPRWADAARRDALAGAARARALLEEDHDALEQWAGELAAIEPGGPLVLQRLAGRPRAVWRRALHQWLMQQRVAEGLSRQAFDALLAAAERGAPTRQSLGVGGFAVVHRGVLRVESVGNAQRNFRRSVN